MSGWRCVGSPIGSGSNTMSEDDPVTSRMMSAKSSIVYSSGLPILTGSTTSES
jgi:hypothetical protein